MRIPSNKIKDIVSFFRKELAEVYEPDELESVIWLSFNFVLGLSRTEMNSRLEDTINQSDLLKLNFICKDLKTHKPLQYVLGETVFCGHTFRVNEHVLIPRPETEELVYIVRDYIKKHYWFRTGMSILDIGTGSGCIAVSLKKIFPEINVWGIDVSAQALMMANENAQSNGAAVNFMLEDILNVRTFNEIGSVEVIVSNPPYVTYDEKGELDKRVLDFEPHLALFASERDPLIFYRAILEAADALIDKHIVVFLELNATYAEEVRQLYEAAGFDAEIQLDMFGKSRFVIAKK